MTKPHANRNAAQTIILPCLLLMLTGSLACAGESTDIQWRFDASEGWTPSRVAALKSKGFTVSGAADSDAALFVQTERLGEVTGFLKLVDVVDSAAGKLDNAGGTPIATLPFAAATTGSLKLRVALDGLQKQQAVIALCSGDTELAAIELTDNTHGQLRVGEQTQAFTDGVKWFMSSRDTSIAWEPASAGGVQFTLTFKPRQGQPATLQGHAAAAPDRLVLRVGYGTAVNRALMIDELQLRTTSK